MAHTGIFATALQCQYKAGQGASSTAYAEAFLNDFCFQAESYINAYTRVNYSDTYSSLNVDKKGLLSEACSNIVAMYIINYDMRNYASLAHAQSMLNVLWDRAEKILFILKDKDTQSFVSGA